MGFTLSLDVSYCPSPGPRIVANLAEELSVSWMFETVESSKMQSRAKSVPLPSVAETVIYMLVDILRVIGETTDCKSRP